MDTAGLINSSLDGIPRFSLENATVASRLRSEQSPWLALIRPEELRTKNFLAVSVHPTTSSYSSVYICTRYFKLHISVCRRRIYLLSCFSSSFSFFLFLSFCLRQLLQTLCSALRRLYNRARDCTQKSTNVTGSLSLSVCPSLHEHVSRHSVYRAQLPTADGRRHCRSRIGAEETSVSDVFHTVHRGNNSTTVHEERLPPATAVNTTMTHDDATDRARCACAVSLLRNAEIATLVTRAKAYLPVHDDGSTTCEHPTKRTRLYPVSHVGRK